MGERMTAFDWMRLEQIDRHGNLKPARGLGAGLLARTRREDEHPENYNGPCECRLCMSYADP
jgi:hypothetical protein